MAVPLHAVSHRCIDARYPALAGPWVVGCNAQGEVATALSLETGRQVDLPDGLKRPGLGVGVVYEVGRADGLFMLEEGASAEVVVVREPTTAPPATDGEHIAILGSEWVQVLTRTQAARSLIEAQPGGWQAPALMWPMVAWVEEGEEGDVWWMDGSKPSKPTVLAAGPGDQRHIVASEGWLAWVDEGDVVVLEVATGFQERHKADTGFSAPPTLWRDVACWEERLGADVDLQCSDGMVIEGRGHQRWPGRWDQWLLYRQDDKAWLYTGEEP